MDTNRNKATIFSSLNAFKAFLAYFRKHRLVMALDLFCALMTTLCDVVLPLIVRYITNAATDVPMTLTWALVLKMGGVYILLRLIDAGAYYYMQSAGHVMASKIEAEMRTQLFGKYLEMPHAFYDNTKIGQLMSRITSDLNDITEFAHHFPEELLIAAVKVVVSFIILCGTNVLLTVIIFAVLPAMVFTSNIFAKRMRKSFKDSRHELGELNAQVEDSLSGIRVVKSFANEPVEAEKFEARNGVFLRIKRIMYRNMAGFHSVTRLFDGLMYIIVVIVGALFMLRGKITPADLVAYLLYVQTLLTTVRRYVEFSEQFQRGITGFERFDEVMREKSDIVDAPNAAELKETKGDIRFEDVSFRYEDELENVLTHIDLHVEPGRSVALVGPSGGGKTTLCSLIPRFYDVTDGAILLDGKDIRRYTLRSLRSRIGVVQQDVHLFSGTVFENIAYGRPGASRAEVEEAAKLAGAHEFILELENGYDSYVGEHGLKLSGGQKQRICIARVFLKDPPILILDEATSALDNESERLVQQSLDKLMRGRTTITIAHRLTTIRNVDEILVLSGDGIVERGTHAELMRREDSLYRRMYSLYIE